jgi:hypothetical protein
MVKIALLEWSNTLDQWQVLRALQKSMQELNGMMKSIVCKPIEFYGELKARHQQQLPDLECILLRFSGISRAPNSDLPRYTCFNIKEIDLSGRETI